MDGGVIIVNLSNGSYNSINNTGVEIWGMIQNGWSVARIIERLLSEYAADKTVVSQFVQQLLSELQTEELIKPMAAPEVTASIKTSSTVFRVNEPDVLSDVVKSEVVLINQKNNQYYSIEGTGVEIWKLLCQLSFPVTSFSAHGMAPWYSLNDFRIL